MCHYDIHNLACNCVLLYIGHLDLQDQKYQIS
jgi:hypothetical protein